MPAVSKIDSPTQRYTIHLVVARVRIAELFGFGFFLAEEHSLAAFVSD
jgi:hypothetical protein